MKLILFLVAIYSLIIHQCYQKKTAVLPLPAPAYQLSKQFVADTTVRRPNTIVIPALYKEKSKEKTTVISKYSLLSPSW